MIKLITVTIISLLLSLAACGNGDESSLVPNGGACELAEDCDSGECWQELKSYHPIFGPLVLTLDNGMCSLECTGLEGTMDELWQGTCEENEYCLLFGTSESICFQSCSENTNCREDYDCTLLTEGRSTCLPPEDAARIIDGSLIFEVAPLRVIE